MLALALVPVLMSCVVGAKLTIGSGHVPFGISMALLALAALILLMRSWSRALRQSPRLPP